MTAQPFRLGTVPALARSTVDRQEWLRADPERLLARWSSARVVLLDDTGRTPVPFGETTLATRKAAAYGDRPPEEAMFLGEWQGVDHWGMPGTPDGEVESVPMRGSWGVADTAPAAGGEVWLDLRGHGDLLDDTSAGLFTTALALRNWHRRARFCARCGGRTRLVQYGWAAVCDSCEREEYPRTDPAVICLVHDDSGVNGERVLLARQPNWPPHRYSVLAGFVEAGESLEGCVTREIREEVGVEVAGVRYLGSQPWPFPRSIMLGFVARADPAAPLLPADGEIESALWATREELRETFANSQTRSGNAVPTPIGGGAGRMLLPGNSSIARVMLEAWTLAEG
ncbi:NAD(+) diphosphatase [Amycolatopsis cihanbeyliensis]|uniref:NAD(+) diphosphatase n=1 Tax=Amycolatopsis cihanbeyliensis TaxID=1128664 RepID=A0A542DPM4_AMYCI|nr:NAD(+) diphosphatase [Amycolatopsis cihanbeyliensis]TQJ04934.1 NAD+ diphosphatase [Amycolatopsis cihanbeyliensis]